MNKNDNLTNIIVKNNANKYIVDEFIRYYKFIYSNYTKSSKSPKENYYKLLTIKKIIDIISNYKKKIINGLELSEIKGVGSKTIARVDEIIKNGKLSEISDTDNQISAITELAKIYGIGPTTASFFYEKFGISNIKDLILANKQGKIKLTHQMKLGIKYKDNLIDKIPHKLIAIAEDFILKKIKLVDKNIIATVCGSYRRQKDFTSDIDILLTHTKLNNKNKLGKYMNMVIESLNQIFIIDKLTTTSKIHFQGFASFKNIPNINNLISNLNLNSSSKLKFDTKNNIIRIDIIIVPFDCYYTALMHFTGSSIFNQKMRLHAKSLDMKLNEYGLFKLVNKQYIKIAIKSEEDIFNVLLIKYIPPEKR